MTQGYWQARWKALRGIVGYVLYRLLALTVRTTAKPRAKTLLVIRIDAIGDYVLFHDFLHEIRRSRKYAGHEITLVGNSAWKEIADSQDAGVVDRFIWLDRKRYESDFSYRREKLREIVAQGYDVVINPRYSREFADSEMVGKIAAREKIGMLGDAGNIRPWQKRLVDRHFTRLLPSVPGVLFEFKRTRAFFEAVLEEPLSVRKPSLQVEPSGDSSLPGNHAVLFIGASAEFRRWSVTGVAEVAMQLAAQGTGLVLCGAPSDRAAADIFARHFHGHYTDLVGKTSLTSLLQVLAGARLVLTNETSVGHFAVALGVPHVVVVSNGNHYGRFSPYPADIAGGYRAVYPPEIEALRQDEAYLQQLYGAGSDLDINRIRAADVMRAIQQTGFAQA